MRIDKQVFDWLKLATGNGVFPPFQNLIHVCDGALWSTDGVRLHCIGDTEKTWPVIASYIPSGYKKFIAKVGDKIQTEALMSSGDPTIWDGPADTRALFEFDTHASFELRGELLTALWHLESLTDSVDLVVSDGHVEATCNLPVFGPVRAIIGHGNGNSRAVINTRYLMGAANIAGGVVEIGEFTTDRDKYKPVRITSEHKGLKITALIMPMVIADR